MRKTPVSTETRSSSSSSPSVTIARGAGNGDPLRARWPSAPPLHDEPPPSDDLEAVILARTRSWGEPIEVMLLVDDLPWEAERAFGRIVGILADEPAALVIGNTFSGRESLGEIARRFGKTGMVLTTPQLGDEALFHVECSGNAGHVLMLVPIGDAERALIDESTLEAFESRLDGADVSDLERASVA